MPYTFVDSSGIVLGTNDVNVSVTAPAGSVGDLLVGIWATRTNTSGAGPTNYQDFGYFDATTAGNSLWMGARFATNDANDNIGFDFTGGSAVNKACILRFSGDIWNGAISGILNQSTVTAENNGNDIVFPGFTPSPETNDLLYIAIASKNKSSSENGVTFTSPTGLDSGSGGVRAGYSAPDGSNHVLIIDYRIISGSPPTLSSGIWDGSIEYTDPSSSYIIAIKPSVAGGTSPTGNISGPLGGPLRGVI